MVKFKSNSTRFLTGNVQLGEYYGLSEVEKWKGQNICQLFNKYSAAA